MRPIFHMQGFLDELVKISAFNTRGLSPETVMSGSQPPPPMETAGFNKAKDILGRASMAKTAAKKKPSQDRQNKRAVAFRQPNIGKLMTANDDSTPEQAKSIAGYALAGGGAGRMLSDFAHGANAPNAAALRKVVHRGTGVGLAAGAAYGGYRAIKKSRDAKATAQPSQVKQGTIIKTATISTPGMALKASKQVGKLKVTPSVTGPSTTTQIRGQLIGRKGIP